MAHVQTPPRESASAATLAGPQRDHLLLTQSPGARARPFPGRLVVRTLQGQVLTRKDAIGDRQPGRPELGRVSLPRDVTQHAWRDASVHHQPTPVTRLYLGNPR